MVRCLAPVCGGERIVAITDLASLYDCQRTVGDVLPFCHSMPRIRSRPASNLIVEPEKASPIGSA